jgi:hypothetical protein
MVKSPFWILGLDIARVYRKAKESGNPLCQEIAALFYLTAFRLL